MVGDQVGSGYCPTPMRDGISLFQLFYGVAPEKLPWNVPRLGNVTEGFRETELLTVLEAGASRVWLPDCGKAKNEKNHQVCSAGSRSFLLLATPW